MANKSKTSSNKADRLFEIFCGEPICISLDRDIEQSSSTRTKIETLKASQMVQGFLVDYDGEYFYLGLEPDTINQAVKKDYIVHVEVMEAIEDDILSEVEVPKDEKGFN